MNHSLCKLYTSYRIAFYVSCVQVVYNMRKPEKGRMDTHGTDDAPATCINRDSVLCKLCKPAIQFMQVMQTYNIHVCKCWRTANFPACTANFPDRICMPRTTFCWCTANFPGRAANFPDRICMPRTTFNDVHKMYTRCVNHKCILHKLQTDMISFYISYARCIKALNCTKDIEVV